MNLDNDANHLRPKGSLGIFIRNVLVKALFLFALLNAAFMWAEPLPALGRISAYNSIFPGRKRLPFGEDSERSYNLSILQLEAMLASHELSGNAKPEDEYRILLVGDSSIWGFLLDPGDTISAQINQRELITKEGLPVRAYNLGYPTLSVTKDLLFLQMGREYDPDLIIWFVTLESLPLKKQLSSPILQHNPAPVGELIDRYDLRLDPRDADFIVPSLLEQTLVGRRRALADLTRLQFYGVMWAATGIDHDVPDTLERPSDDQPDDMIFDDYHEGSMPEEALAFDVLEAGVLAAGDIPLLLINEPIFIASGENSEIRYNSFYPRWAYDQYREWLAERVELEGWLYVDLWDLVPPDAFTDSAIHYSTNGVARVVDRIRLELEEVNGAID